MNDMAMPCSSELEDAILGTAMRVPEFATGLFQTINERCFYQNRARIVYLAVQKRILNGGIAHDALIREDLKFIDDEERTIDKYVIGLSDTSFTVSRDYTDKLTQYASRRRAIEISNELFKASFDTSVDYEGVVEKACAELATINSTSATTEPEHMSEIVPKALAEIEAGTKGAITGITTGLKDFDSACGGLLRGDLVVVAGRPSMGKTALAECFAAHQSQNEPVVFFSQEMGSTRLAMRDFARNTGFTMKELRKLPAEKYGYIHHRAQESSQLKMWIDETSSVSVVDIRARSSKIKKVHGLSMIVVDYIQLMKPSSTRGATREQQIAEISRGLKSIAKDIDVAVVALSQLSRRVEEREDKRPMLSDLRESGSIEQDADMVIMVYRDEYYDADSEDKGIAEIGIAKYRNGETGWIKFAFDAPRMKFADLSKHPDNLGG